MASDLKNTPSSLFIIDGDNLLKRCWYAAHRGGDNAPLHAFIAALMRVVRNHRGGMAVVVWDGGHAPWRKLLLPNYKVRVQKPGREARDMSIETTTIGAHSVMKAMQITQIGFVGVEADDVIAYLARCCSRARVYSNDKDFFSLIKEDMLVVRPVNGEDMRIGLSNFEKHAGVATPTHYRMFKAIAGDKSDVIEGVPGVGEKTARDILAGIPEEELTRDAPLRGMQAVLDVCKDAKSKRWRRVFELKADLEVALRCSDLSGPHLLAYPYIPRRLKEILTFRQLAVDMGYLEHVMRGLEFSPSQIPSRATLADRVTSLEPDGVDFSWARNPSATNQWGI
jgi:5'-3' exonuclease